MPDFVFLFFKWATRVCYPRRVCQYFSETCRTSLSAFRAQGVPSLHVPAYSVERSSVVCTFFPWLSHFVWSLNRNELLYFCEASPDLLREWPRRQPTIYVQVAISVVDSAF